jgi:hypothetical protein
MQCQTIADRIEALPAPSQGRPELIEIHSGTELLAVSWDELMVAGELVVEGIVQPIRSYVSGDGCTVLTDYSLALTHVHRGRVPAAKKPGAAELLTVTTVGGETSVDGVRVIVRYEQLAPFAPGQHVLFVLTRASDGSYRLAKGSFGAFAVEAGRVKHLLRSAGGARFDDLDRTTFIEKVKRR